MFQRANVLARTCLNGPRELRKTANLFLRAVLMWRVRGALVSFLTAPGRVILH